MLLSNLELLGSEDTLKFVVSSRRDMEKAHKFWKSTGWSEKRQFISALYLLGIQPVRSLDFLMEKKLNLM